MKQLLVALCFFSSLASVAQEKTSDDKLSNKAENVTQFVSISPQYAFIDGFRIEVDKKINQNNWIQIAPIVFVRNSFPYENVKDLKGLGLHVYHRYFPGEGIEKYPVYISWGSVYHYHAINYEEDGLIDKVSKKTELHKFGFDVIIGLAFLTESNLVLDLYTGMGIRNTWTKSNSDNPLLFNDHLFDYGYSGVVPLLGIRIGIVFN